MAFNIKAAGLISPAAKFSVRGAGVLRPARSIKMMAGGVLQTVQTFVSPLTAAAVPSDVSGFGSTFKPSMVFSNSTTATPTGGAAPYTYSWAIIAGSAMITSIPENATTTFSQVLYGTTINATARCTITDAYGSVATCDAQVMLQHQIS